MMKKSILFGFTLCMCVIWFTSCIKEEALNAEADIELADIPNGDIALQMSPSIGNNTVSFRLKRFDGSYLQAPEFVLTPGATIEPASGTERDFFEPQTYIVTSEDGVWSKTYTVSFIIDENADFFSAFEHAEIVDTDEPEGHFHLFFDYTENGQKRFNWSTANEGYNILAETLVGEGETLEPAFYPTAQTSEGYIGNGVKLQTKATGPLGDLFGSPLAAGNLFVGEFHLTFPTIMSTRFGLSYNHDKAPVALKGFFKYEAGKDFIVNTAPSERTKDTWDGYAILFEKRENSDENYLQGDHGFTDERIVGVARIGAEQHIETNEWTAFEAPFSFVNGKSFDPAKEYMYTIVFSSSLEGDLFNGAVGSTLWIDEVELVVEESE